MEPPIKNELIPLSQIGNTKELSIGDSNKSSSASSLDLVTVPLKGAYTKTPLKQGTLFLKYPFFPIRSSKTSKKYLIDQKTLNGRQRITIEVNPDPTIGSPSVSDSDVIIYAVSCFKEELEKKKAAGETVPQTYLPCITFDANDFFAFTARPNDGGQRIKSLRKSLDRLLKTSVTFQRRSENLNETMASTYLTEWREVQDPNNPNNALYQLIFTPWMLPLFIDNKQVLTLNKQGYFMLDPLEKKYYQYFRATLGNQQYFRLHLKTLAVILGVTKSTNDKMTAKEISLIRNQIKTIILTGSLPGISLAIEPRKNNGSEVVVAYKSNWKFALTDYAHPYKKRRLRQLELQIYLKEGIPGLRWFDGEDRFGTDQKTGLIRTEMLRATVAEDDPLAQRYRKDQVLKHKVEVLKESVKPSEMDRYKLIRLCELIANQETPTRNDLGASKVRELKPWPEYQKEEDPV